MKFSKLKGISAGGLAVNQSSGGEKIVLYRVCFA